MDVLIDGYNLIFQLGWQGRRSGSNALEASRNRLVSELTHRLDEEARAKVTIVFDSRERPIKAVSNDLKINGMRVLFASGYDDADALIEELIRQHPHPKTLTVVSSDHRIHRAAERRNAKPFDSDVWLDRLDNPHRVDESQSRRVDEKQIPPGLNDVDWAAEFEIRENEKKRDQRRPGKKGSSPPSYNPFPPGYGEDLLE